MTDYGTAETKCVKCGACTSVCPVYQVTGKESLTARGRLHLIDNPPERISAVYSEIFSQCLLCGACEDACPRGIKIRDTIIKTRTDTVETWSYLHIKQLTAQKTLASPFLLKYFGNITKKLTELPQESGLLQKLTVFTPKLPSLSQPAGQPGPANKKKGEINYFSGCLANYLVPDIKEATINLVRQAGRYGCRTNEGQTCCGLVSYTAGRIEQAQKTARLNIEAFEDNNYPILTSCASCYFHLRSYPDILSGDPVWVKKARLFSERLRELSCFMVEEIPENFSPRKGERIRVAIHDPCHLRFGREKITEPPRQLIRKAGNITLLEIPERCCGHGGLFQMKYPELSHKIADKKIKDLSTALPHYLLTTCSGCLLQLNRAAVRSGLPIKTCHLSVFINHFL